MQSSNQKLRKAIAGIPDPPCVGCGHRQYCTVNETVCDGFKVYVNQVGGKTGRHNHVLCCKSRELNIESWSTLEPKEGFDQEKKPKPVALPDTPDELYLFREGGEVSMPVAWVNLLPAKEVKLEEE